MAKYGNHSYRQSFISDADVKRFFQSKGVYWDDLVQKCRNPKEIVDILENLIGSTWKVSGGGKASVVTDAATNKETEITSVSGPGEITISTYLQLFENAVDNLSRCIDSASFGDFQSCVSNGIASIDAYIEHRVFLYNSAHPSEQLIDSKESKVSQDTKFDEWIPKMSGGKKLDKSRLNWSHFKRLRAVRDELAIHVKKPAFGINYHELGELLNVFRSGIAGLLLDLHVIFGERVPCNIIRNAYLPDISLVEIED
jgi:hypothetical protein